MLQKQFAEIVQLIKYSRSDAIRVVNTELINLYWRIGEYISKKVASASWGDKTVDELAAFINQNFPELKGFNRRGLYRMKLFYETYAPMEFVSQVMTQIQLPVNQESGIVTSVMTQFETSDIKGSLLTKISWTHHLILISRTKTTEEREFYLRLCINENYSIRELERQINSGVFERVIMGNQKLPTGVSEVHPHVTNSFKDSYIFEFLNLPEDHNESDLQKGLIGQMRNFILELGKDFLFVGEEFRVQVGNSDFFIDLLFYHRNLQCLVAFELKTDKFKPEHLGQLNFYLEALDRDVRKTKENPSIGVLLCKDKDTEVVEYALSRTLSPTLISEYRTQLPDKKLLQQKLHELFEYNNKPE